MAGTLDRHMRDGGRTGRLIEAASALAEDTGDMVAAAVEREADVVAALAEQQADIIAALAEHGVAPEFLEDPAASRTGRGKATPA